jgi:hypothetical protein
MANVGAEEQGMDSASLAQLVNFVGIYKQDSLLIVRHGKIVVDAYYALRPEHSARFAIGDEELHRHADRDRGAAAPSGQRRPSGRRSVCRQAHFECG